MLEKFLKRLQGIHLNDVDHDGGVIFIKTNTNRLFTVHCSLSTFCDFQAVFQNEVLLSYQISSKKFLPHSPQAVFHWPVKSFRSQRLKIRNTLFTLVFIGFKVLTSDGYKYFFFVKTKLRKVKKNTNLKKFFWPMIFFSEPVVKSNNFSAEQRIKGK